MVGGVDNVLNDCVLLYTSFALAFVLVMLVVMRRMMLVFAAAVLL